MAKNKVKTHTFNKVKYEIHFLHDCDGAADTRHSSQPNLEVFCKPYTRNELISLIHEALHAEGNNQEERVEMLSREIGSFLWRLGYRR